MVGRKQTVLIWTDEGTNLKFKEYSWSGAAACTKFHCTEIISQKTIGGTERKVHAPGTKLTERNLGQLLMDIAKANWNTHLNSLLCLACSASFSVYIACDSSG